MAASLSSVREFKTKRSVPQWVDIHIAALSKDVLWERERVRASCASSSTVRFPRAARSACRQDWTLKSKCGTLNRPRRWI